MAHSLVLRYENACRLILWFDEQHHDEPWYTGKCARAVDHQASKLYFKAAKEPYWECGYLKASQLRSFLLLLITLLA